MFYFFIKLALLFATILFDVVWVTPVIDPYNANAYVTIKMINSQADHVTLYML